MAQLSIFSFYLDVPLRFFNLLSKLKSKNLSALGGCQSATHLYLEDDKVLEVVYFHYMFSPKIAIFIDLLKQPKKTST